jgi:hypothetical protein
MTTGPSMLCPGPWWRRFAYQAVASGKASDHSYLVFTSLQTLTRALHLIAATLHCRLWCSSHPDSTAQCRTPVQQTALAAQHSTLQRRMIPLTARPTTCLLCAACSCRLCGDICAGHLPASVPTTSSQRLSSLRKPHLPAQSRHRFPLKALACPYRLPAP